MLSGISHDKLYCECRLIELILGPVECSRPFMHSRMFLGRPRPNIAPIPGKDELQKLQVSQPIKGYCHDIRCRGCHGV